MVPTKRTKRRLSRKLTQKQQVKLVHVIRHGEAQHNVNEAFLRKRNPRLTARGQRQAKSLRRLARKLKSDVVLTSPGLRALQTTATMQLADSVVVVPDARERFSCSEHLCDLPADTKTCASLDKFKNFDWSLARRNLRKARGVQKYERKMAHEDRSEAAIKLRARKLTKYLLARPENHITVVSHGAFLMRLTGDEYFGNCEVRTYEVRTDEWKLRKAYRIGCNTE